MFDDSLPVERNALIHTEIKYLETVSSHTSTDEWKDAIYCETVKKKKEIWATSVHLLVLILI